MILLIDNYDSFTFNLHRYLTQMEQTVVVARNDVDTLDGALEACSAIIISPGPKAPDQAGRCLEIISRYAATKPMLGICLGHQAICQAFGAKIDRAQRPMHGRATPIDLLPSPLFQDIPTPMLFGRYHSLVATPASIVDQELQVIGWSAEREVMAVAHRRWPVYGVQFHPESILSTYGCKLLANFLTICGLAVPLQLPVGDLQAGASAEGSHLAFRPADEVCSVTLPSSRYLVELP